MEYVMIYGTYDSENKFTGETAKRGSSVEHLQNWAKENGISDYQICFPMYEVNKLHEKLNILNKSLIDLSKYAENASYTANYDI